MNIFSTLKSYATPWVESARRNFSEEEKNAIESTKVVDSEYGLSVCFMMKAGGMTYIPLSRDSKLTEGASVDLNSASLITLSRQGEEDIVRVRE